MEERNTTDFAGILSNIRRRTAGRGIRLVEKSRRGAVSLVFSRSGLIVLLMLLQIAFFLALSHWLSEYAGKYFTAAGILSFAVVLYIINSRMVSTAKVTWLFLILALPVFGIMFYIHTVLDIGHRKLKKRAGSAVKKTMGAIAQDMAVIDDLGQRHPEAAALVRYMGKTGCYPAYRDCGSRYFPCGEDFFKALLADLAEAERFIFLEYFIIEEGVMWGRILEILAAKAKVGVEVRIIYDGTCEFSRLPHGYPEKLARLGIDCKVYSPIQPFVSTKYNYRDHRKIAVIDGRVAYTGGVNLADEYINEISPYGKWKDAAVRLEGPAVGSFTLMFLQSWFSDGGDIDLGDYVAASSCGERREQTRGFAVPFGDVPTDDEKVGENVYIDILSRARRYVYIMTPYLVLDGELEQALRFAAGRGVDVKLIVPGHNDSLAMDALGVKYCADLIDYGVKVYEWTPGFIHSKVFVADGERAVVGTINLDFRSLYHNLECAVYLHGTDCIPEVEKDFLAALKECRAVTRDCALNPNPLMKAYGALLRVFAPLI